MRIYRVTWIENFRIAYLVERYTFLSQRISAAIEDIPSRVDRHSAAYELSF